jgi:hypothetical protein
MHAFFACLSFARFTCPTCLHSQVVIVGESFGGVLGLRVALAAPHLVRNMALVNPGTFFFHWSARLNCLRFGRTLSCKACQPGMSCLSFVGTPELCEIYVPNCAGRPRVFCALLSSGICVCLCACVHALLQILWCSSAQVKPCSRVCMCTFFVCAGVRLPCN